jgi:hypothetical protein
LVAEGRGWGIAVFIGSVVGVDFYFVIPKYKMSTQSSGAFTDLGKREDLYYTDPDNCKVESIPVEYNTRYSQDFSNKSSGTSVFIIPPKLLGLSD